MGVIPLLLPTLFVHICSTFSQYHCVLGRSSIPYSAAVYPHSTLDPSPHSLDRARGESTGKSQILDREEPLDIMDDDEFTRACERCTFSNFYLLNECEMCGYVWEKVGKIERPREGKRTVVNRNHQRSTSPQIGPPIDRANPKTIKLPRSSSPSSGLSPQLSPISGSHTIGTYDEKIAADSTRQSPVLVSPSSSSNLICELKTHQLVVFIDPECHSLLVGQIMYMHLKPKYVLVELLDKIDSDSDFCYKKTTEIFTIDLSRQDANDARLCVHIPESFYSFDATLNTYTFDHNPFALYEIFSESQVLIMWLFLYLIT